jgi:hypothetical protein
MALFLLDRSLLKVPASGASRDEKNAPACAPMRVIRWAPGAFEMAKHKNAPRRLSREMS